MMPSMSRVANTRRRRGALSRERIVTAALELSDRVGLEGLTMRALAEELGCGTMSLYSHIEGRDDLLAGIVALVIERMDLHYIPGESWQDCARRTTKTYRALAHEHPAAFELLVFADNTAEPVASYLEHLVWLFRQGGLEDEAAKAFLSAADAFASGILLMQCRELRRRREQGSADDELARERPYLAEPHAARNFDTGPEVLIRGIEQIFPGAAGSPERPAGSPETPDGLDA